MRIRSNRMGWVVGCFVCVGIVARAESGDFESDRIKAAVEASLRDWKRATLVEFADGTGKTDAEREQILEVLEGRGNTGKTEEVRIVTIENDGERTMVCALCPSDRGWLPLFFECRTSGERIESNLLQERGGVVAGQHGMEAYLSDIREKRDGWCTSQGPELLAKTNLLKNRLQGEIAALELAEREGLPIVPGYGTTATFRTTLERLRHLSPEEIRDCIVAELDAAVKSMSVSER